MQMSNQKKVNKNIKIKKSHLLLIGSLLIFDGVLILVSNHLQSLKSQVFADMQVIMSTDNMEEKEETISDAPVASNISQNDIQESNQEDKENINYDKYLGVLEIPRISLKRGFYNIDSKYNDISHNVTLVKGSTMPDIDKGNLILMAHSGDAYVSYFAYLYKMKIGNYIYITYNGVKYKYKLVNIYDVAKTGSVTIVRNYDKTTLTLITCTKDDSTKQTIYIAELVS